jgi:hypothetical protein
VPALRRASEDRAGRGYAPADYCQLSYRLAPAFGFKSDPTGEYMHGDGGRFEVAPLFRAV